MREDYLELILSEELVWWLSSEAFICLKNICISEGKIEGDY